jgi:calmodulin
MDRWEIMEFFDLLDLDNSGFLDRDEIHELLIRLRQPPTEAELSIIMGQLDADGNGVVELSDFMD